MTISTRRSGELHLIPVTLGGDDATAVIPPATLAAITALDYFIVENEKSARRFLKNLRHPLPLQQLELRLFNERCDAKQAIELLQPLLAGRSAGLLSEAGCPAIADPGALLVEVAHRHGLRVVPHVGPSALTLALMASGFNGQRFAFHGYLPVNKDECRARLLALERESQQHAITQIFIETPYRNDTLLQTLIAVCRGATRLCIASDLTLPTESVRSATVAEWKHAPIRIGKRPSVFLLYAR